MQDIDPYWHGFLDAWKRAAADAGVSVPARQNIRPAIFSTLMDRMMIADWDFQSGLPLTRYTGSRVEGVLGLVPREAAADHYLKTRADLELHKHAAMFVVKHRVGLLLSGTVVRDSGTVVTLQQLRLPLESADGPGIVSLWRLLDMDDPGPAPNRTSQAHIESVDVIDLGFGKPALPPEITP